MALTASWVNIYISDNATFQDAFQFTIPNGYQIGTNTWEMGVKASRDDVANLALFTSAAGQITIADPVNNIINMNVPDTTIQSELPCGTYDYDLIMTQGSVRTQMMQGKLIVKHGVSET